MRFTEIVDFVFHEKYQEQIADEIKRGLERITIGTILEYYKAAKRTFRY